MKFSPEVFESLQSKLKVGNRRGVHLNAIPGNSRYKFDLSRLSLIKKSLPELFILDLLTLRDVNFSFTTQFKELPAEEKPVAKDSIYLNNYDDISPLPKKEKVIENTEEKEAGLKKLASGIENLIFQNEVVESEKGMNTLGFGFPLLIRRDANDNQISASPLLIWTVRIKPTTAMNTWVISRTEDDPIYLNEVLVNHLQSDSGIVLSSIAPEMLEDGKIDKPELLSICNSILEQLQVSQNLDFILDNYAPIPTIKAKAAYEKMLPKRGDAVIEKCGIFSLFEVQKQNIINDYNELIASYSFEEKAPNESFQTITSVETDPSQQGILESLKTNSKIVIQGPPGTGKSQTLTALLINALENQQKTIVVCEKQTALEVLQKALQQKGLGDFCTMIKDSVSDRRIVVDQVRTKIDAPKFKQNKEVYPQSVVQEMLDGIQQNKRDINQSHHKLNEKVIQDQDWSEIIGHILTLKKEKEELNLDPSLFDFTTTELDSLLEMIAKGQPYFEKFQPYKNEAFFTPEKLIAKNRFETEQELKDSFAAYQKKLDEIKTAAIQYQSFYFERRKEEFASQLATLEQLIHEIIVSTATLSASSDEFNLQKTGGFFYRLAAFFSSSKKEVLKVQKKLKANVTAIKSLSLHANFHEIAIGSDLYQNVKSAQEYVAKIQWAKDEFPSKIETDFDTLDLLHFYDSKFQNTDLKFIAENTKNLKQLVIQDNWVQIKSKGNSYQESIQEMETLLVRFQTASKEPYLASHDWFSFYYSLSEKNKQFIDLLVPISNWQASFLYAYYNLLLLKNSDGRLAIKEESYANFTKKVKLFESTQKNYIESFWNNSQLLALQKFEKSNPDITVANLYNKRKSTKFNRLTLRQIANMDTDLFTSFFPILLTTPDACSNLFQGKNFYFDNVVFDEASQLKLEDNLPAMLKGKNIIIAGDEHQMPPSNYFSKVFDGTFEDEDDMEDEAEIVSQKSAILSMESLLDFAMEFQFDKNYLDFHYRSKHPYLIDFSNHAFYGSRLKPLPSSNPNKPIDFIEVDGVFDEHINEAEADKIIEILGKIEPHPNGTFPSVGIATFNITQRNYIKRKIIQKQNEPNNTAFNEKITALEEAGLFIKNLENIQGDERDIILISTTYGKKKDGKFIQAFGPINHSKGYKLLNVIITRAKEKVIVCTSIPQEYYGNYKDALEKEGANNRRAVFYAYLSYCKAVSDENENKRREILRDLDYFSHSAREEERPSKRLFKEQVLEQAKERFPNLNFQLNHPFGGYAIDILIEPNGAKPIALECLSKKEYEGELAYLEDLHKEKILKNAGFGYVRIWSQDWWQHTERELDKLKKVLEA